MKLLILSAMILFAQISIAGPGSGHAHGHDHRSEISKVKTVIIAQEHIKRLIKSKKLIDSWKNAEFENAVKKKFGNRDEWVVTFLNKQLEDKQKLFIFLSTNGDFIAANFTGK